MVKIEEGYGMTRDGRKVRIKRDYVSSNYPYFHDGSGGFHGLTSEGKSCIDSDDDDIVAMLDDDATGPAHTLPACRGTGFKRGNEMTIKIEKNIPIPGHGNRKYPFHEMEVGDSFFVPDCKSSKLAGSAHTFKRRSPGAKFTIRKEGTGVRCWRIA